MSTSIAEAVINYVAKHPEILDENYPDVDVMDVRGLVFGFSDLPLSPKYQDLPPCGERCKKCVFYINGKCDPVRQAFCENFIEDGE